MSWGNTIGAGVCAVAWLDPANEHWHSIRGNRFANPDRSAHHEAGGGRGLQPPSEASIRNGSAAQPLAGLRGAAPLPTCCSQHNSRSVLRFFGNGG